MKKSGRALRMAQPLAVVAVWAGLLGYVIPAAFATPPAVTATASSAASGTPARPDRAPAGLPRPTAAAGHARTGAQPSGPANPVPDRLPHPAESAMVRVIQASPRARRVTVTLGGQDLARNQPFASVTPYRPVSPGTWTVRVSDDVTGASGRVAMRITLAPDTRTTLVVLDDRGRLAVSAPQARPDVEKLAAGSAVPPAARPGAEPSRSTPKAARSPITWLVLASTGLLLGLAGAARLRHLRWARRVAGHIP
jgi:hypothetical protein